MFRRKIEGLRRYNNEALPRFTRNGLHLLNSPWAGRDIPWLPRGYQVSEASIFLPVLLSGWRSRMELFVTPPG